MVERFNGTLKTLLRKNCSDPQDWDTMLPFLLFAYREAPHSTTGFSPFELLYGRHVRGPLDVMREEWVAKTTASQSVISYVLEMRNKLDQMGTIATAAEEMAKSKTKVWYDRGARSRSLTEGDQVLVLLPVGSDKLSAQWQGPYTVLKKVSPVSYCIDMHDKKKRRRQFHVNMLKEWHTPAAAVLQVAIMDQQQSDGDDIDCATVVGEAGHPEIGKQLTPQQRDELDQLLTELDQVFSVHPGRTEAAEHTIDTGDVPPFRLAPYRVPKACSGRTQEHAGPGSD